MGWLMATVYDRMMARTEEACLAEWRRGLLGSIAGEVLEIGAGTGVNLPHYSDAALRVQLCEPDPDMRSRLRKKARHDARMQVLEHGVEEMPFAEGAFDAVVSTLVLCSVPDPARALSEVHRVLKPGGAFAFLEHVAAEPGTARLRWQGRIEPLWLRLAGNCHITRTTERSIEDAGLRIESLERQSMRKALPWVRPTIRGIARKPA